LKYVRIVDSKRNSVVVEIKIPDEYDVLISVDTRKEYNTEEAQAAFVLQQNVPAVQTPPISKGQQTKESKEANHERDAVEAVKEIRREVESNIENIFNSILGETSAETGKEAEKPTTNVGEYMQKEIARVETMAKSLTKSPEERKKEETIESIVSEILDFRPEG